MKKIICSLSLILVDIFSILISICIAISIRKIFNIYFDVPIINYSYVRFWAVYITIIAVLCYLGCYTKRYDFWFETKLIAKANLLAFILLFAGLALGQNSEYYSRSTLLFIFLFSSLFIPIGKYIAKAILFKFHIWKLPVKIITENEEFRSNLFHSKYLGYVEASKDEKHKILFIDGANLGKEKLNKIIEGNIKDNREIMFSPVLNEYDFSQSSIYNVFDSRTNVFILENSLLKIRNRVSKTAIDYIVVVLSCFFWIPVLLLVAYLIKREDHKGDILFKQPRLGVNGQEFICYKFRTMYSDQSFMDQWLIDNPEEKEYYEKYHKYVNDPRITKIGALLRKTSLDELPQLINVLKGEMSLVGPRPYLVTEKSDIGYKSSLVLAVKPGITGLWQVSGRSEVDFDSRVEMDVWYMKNWSLWNDAIILVKTIQTVLKRDGAY
ncbi:sugar transferase [Lonepinella sp. BR2919]|uniref:sugar transferase n=1 Tax=unclassified Lonepinella TaxID=2642006 RepID=UPI003F6DC33D